MLGVKGRRRGKEARRTPPRRVCYSLHAIVRINPINSVSACHDAVVTTTGHSSPRLYVSLRSTCIVSHRNEITKEVPLRYSRHTNLPDRQKKLTRSFSRPLVAHLTKRNASKVFAGRLMTLTSIHDHHCYDHWQPRMPFATMLSQSV